MMSSLNSVLLLGEPYTNAPPIGHFHVAKIGHYHVGATEEAKAPYKKRKGLNFRENWTIKRNAMFWKKRKKKKGRDDLNRRREPRSEDGFTITLTPRDSPGPRRDKTLYYGRTNNASPSGLMIDCDVRFPVGTVLSIQLQSPRNRPLIT